MDRVSRIMFVKRDIDAEVRWFPGLSTTFPVYYVLDSVIPRGSLCLNIRFLLFVFR